MTSRRSETRGSGRMPGGPPAARKRTVGGAGAATEGDATLVGIDIMEIMVAFVPTIVGATACGVGTAVFVATATRHRCGATRKSEIERRPAGARWQGGQRPRRKRPDGWRPGKGITI